MTDAIRKGRAEAKYHPRRESGQDDDAIRKGRAEAKSGNGLQDGF